MILEVLALLVQATVFKIAGSHGNHVIGGFDSHALPPSSITRQTRPQRASMHTLVSVQIGKPKNMAAQPQLPLASKPWRSAIFKTAVLERVSVGPQGVIGDGQADLKNHGGHDKAICVYPAEHLPFWQRHLGRADFDAGAFGENFTVAGLNESSVAIGDRWEMGTAIFEVSQPRQPCWKLARRWQAKKLAVEVINAGKTGWYLRVVQSGKIQRGDSIHVTPVNDAAVQRFSISDANQIYYEKRPDVSTVQKLLEVPQLSQAWRSELQRKIGLT